MNHKLRGIHAFLIVHMRSNKCHNKIVSVKGVLTRYLLQYTHLYIYGQKQALMIPVSLIYTNDIHAKDEGLLSFLVHISMNEEVESVWLINWSKIWQRLTC